MVALGEAAGRLIYEVVLTDAQGDFPFGAATLPDDAKARLDTLIGRIPPSSMGVYLEIEGHTDSTGPEELNDRLGLERAEAGREAVPSRKTPDTTAQDECHQLW